MARIKEDDIDTLRERADIVEIVSGYTALKKSGGHTFKGLCPFHTEKTPSFTVDTAKSVYFCFGCQEGGNLYNFIEKIENLSFPEAVEWLARRLGAELHYEESRPGEEGRRNLKQRLQEANRLAAEFFHQALISSPEADEARRYLMSRNFEREVAVRWKLGYAPGRDSLYKHLLSRRFTAEEMLQADLVRKSERGTGFYDTFRQRITFPTWDLNGNVVGFGGRALGDTQPKYLNTSETPVFVKSRVMYGLDRAKRTLALDAPALVVEGYTDVIALHEAGIPQAVATNGVALGDTHFEQLKRFTQRVILMMDSDQAGQGATERSFGAHQRIGVEVLVAPLPAGRDPADVVSGDGVDGIHKAIDAARPLLEFKLEQSLARLPLDTPEARSRAVGAAAEVLGWHPDPIARHEYAFMAAERIGVDPGAIQRALGEQAARASGAAGGDRRDVERRLPGHVKVEREALQLLLAQVQDVASWAERVDDREFTSNVRREVFRATREAVDGGVDIGPSFVEGLSDDARSLVTELLVESQPPSEDDDLSAQMNEVFTRLQVFGLERDIKSRRNTLQDVNPIEQPERHDELFTELVGLEAKRRDLLKTLRGDR